MLLNAPKRPDHRELRFTQGASRYIGFNLIPGGIRVDRYDADNGKWIYVDVMPDLECALGTDFDAKAVDPF